MAVQAALLFLATILAHGVVARAAEPATQKKLTPVHVVFLTDCTMYSNWQSLGMSFSFKMSGQPGSVSKVMCCTPDEKKKYNQDLLHDVETWIAPSFTIHPRTHDNYAAYNKPEAVIDWLEHVTPEEEYVLVLDSDMILRRPFLVEELQPKPGMGVGARYTYMIGVANELADRHIPEIGQRNDTLAGPFGRRADQVGGFFFLQRDDLKRMSKLWLKYTEDVRADDQAYRLSGDVYAIHPGDKPWISEMYGYAFGAAKANVWHKWDTTSMIYPQYEPHGVPKLLHYGLLFQAGNWSFDKHWHYDFDVTKCPPWDLSNPKRITGGIFEHPPRPSELPNKGDVTTYYRDLISLETVTTLNAGFCDYHLRHCPPTQQLYDVCKEAIERYNEVQDAIAKTEPNFGCTDWHAKCPEWTKNGECNKNKEYMAENCKKSCKVCGESLSGSVTRGRPTQAMELLQKLQETLKGGSTTSTTTTTTSASKAQATDPDTNAKQQAAKVVIEAKSSPVEAPKDSPSPSPSPSPEVHKPATKLNKRKSQGTQLHNNGAQQASKQLLIRCYRMALSLEEVKECVAAAQKGQEYQRKKAATTTATTADDSAAADATSNIKVASHDADDLSLHQEKVEAPVVEQASSKRRSLATTVSSMPTWQVLGLWLVVVAVALTVVPRIFRLRRRQRSGMRTE